MGATKKTIYREKRVSIVEDGHEAIAYDDLITKDSWKNIIEMFPQLFEEEAFFDAPLVLTEEQHKLLKEYGGHLEEVFEETTHQAYDSLKNALSLFVRMMIYIHVSVRIEFQGDCGNYFTIEQFLDKGIDTGDLFSPKKGGVV